MEGKTNKIISIPEKTVTWLLNSQTPSIRYHTFTNLLHRPSTDAEVSSIWKLIPKTKPVSSILAQQELEGFWVYKRHFYTPKYRSSHWTMLHLTELAVQPSHPSMQLGADFMLNIKKEASYYNIEEAIGFSCFWGNWLRYQIYCGNINEPKVEKVIEFICEDIHRSSKCKYNNGLPCAWGVVRSLFGLALIPENSRSVKIEKAIARGLQFLLEDYDLLSANYPIIEKIHPYWLKLNYPLFYHADILFVLRILYELKALKHPGAAPALQWLGDKQTKDGKWRGASPLRKRSRPFLVEPDTPSHWITLHAATILNAVSA